MRKETPKTGKGRLPSEDTRADAVVFSDRGHRRRALVRAVALFAGILAVGWLASFSLSIYFVEKLTGPGLVPTPAVSTGDAPGPADPAPIAGTVDEAMCPLGSERLQGVLAGTAEARSKVYAYLPAAPDWAATSLGVACGVIDVLLPDLFSVDAPNPAIVSIKANAADEPEDSVPHLLRALRASGKLSEIMPVLTITYPEAETPAPGFLTGRAEQDSFSDEVVKIVTENDYPGVCIRPIFLPEEGVAGFKALFQEVDRKLSAVGRQSCLVTSAEGFLWRDPDLVAAAKRVVFLAFKQPWAETPPGPLAAQGWFDEILGEAVAAVGADKLVIALGNFGQDWISGQSEPELIGYAEAMRRAAQHQGRITLPSDALNTTVRLIDAEGRHHEIWLLDAVSLFNQRVTAARYHPAGIALWSLGFEDPGSWAALSATTAGDLEKIEAVTLQDYVGYDGKGPFMWVRHAAEDGRRNLLLNTETGLIEAQTYETIPQPFSVERFGAGMDDMVALTFDDGPDPQYTPALLDVLHAEKVPATFFLIGSNILQSPDVARRIVAEGHEIGSHTFFHPDIGAVPDLRKRLELNAVQRLIVSVTGRSTLLFRSPYGRGTGPMTADEARPFLFVDDSGYIVVGSNVVPPDWVGATPGAIVASALAQLKPSGGNVIVLHDGGGDRSATVAAVPLLIEALRAKGYRFVSLGTMLGVDNDVLMPPEDGALVTFDAYSFSVLGMIGSILRAIFWFAIGLGLVRSLAILILAHLRRHYPTDGAAYTPSVTVVIPAYNEEDVILASIETALASDYPELKLIVVDDGSKDHTCERVKAAYGNDPRVAIINEPNSGKWMALDTAYANIDSEVVVAIDADTIIQPDAIAKLVRAFRDPKVGAVAGKVEIRNRGRLLTKLQALEYMTAQNLDRRAAEVFNGMLVVPGAIGAWRAEAVRKAGLYTGETLAEDADLTVAVLRAGYRVVFEEGAVSATEAPETVRAFMRQRLRWTFGMMQTAWKHRRAAREGLPVGLISIPDLWLFGVALALLAPLADLVFLGVVLGAITDLVLGRPVLQSPVSVDILAGYLSLPLIDLLGVLLAFRFERKVPLLALLVPVQRLIYRPLLYVTVYRAVLRALTGKIAGWGKLARLRAVRVPDA